MYIRVTKYLFIHAAFLLMAFFSLFTPAAKTFWLTFCFALFHEGFHYLAACMLRVPVNRITLLPYGCHLRLGPASLANEVKIVLAGPLGSFLLFLLFRTETAGRINLMLCLFNLLPALPLDGGRLLRLFLWCRTGIFYGNRILRRVGLVLGAALLLFSFFSLSLPAGYVGGILLSGTRHLPTSPLSQKKAEKTTRTKTFPVKSTDSLLHLSRYFSPFYDARFFVTNKNIFLSEKTVSTQLAQNAAARVTDALCLPSGEKSATPF